MDPIKDTEQPKNEPEPRKDPAPEPKKDPAPEPKKEPASEPKKDPEPESKKDPGADYLSELDAKAAEGKPTQPKNDPTEALTRAEQRAELAEARLKAVSDAYVELRRQGVEVKPKVPESPKAISIEELVAATRGHQTPDIIR